MICGTLFLTLIIVPNWELHKDISIVDGVCQQEEKLIRFKISKKYIENHDEEHIIFV